MTSLPIGGGAERLVDPGGVDEISSEVEDVLAIPPVDRARPRAANAFTWDASARACALDDVYRELSSG